MQRDPHKYLIDIHEAIDSIESYLGEKRDFDHYLKNKLLRRAVERELEIIGEAMKRLLNLDPETPISDARRIVDLRNWVIHGYDKVDDVIVWGIISKDLPKLKSEVALLLKG